MFLLTKNGLGIRKKYWFEATWEWVGYDKTLIFGWTVLLTKFLTAFKERTQYEIAF